MIDVRELTYCYPKGLHPAVNGMSFAIGKGEIFGLLGPSGAGKSTVQKILTGLLREYKGGVTVLGHDMRRPGRSFFERIGVSFELPNLYLRFTGRENLELAAALYGGETEPADSLLEWVRLEEDRDRRVSTYSKGMKMRLNFVRAFVGKPELLFLDEPTSGLDPGNAQVIKQLIRQAQREGRTALLTTHDMHVAAELCDRVAFVVDGRMVLVDSPRQLAAHEGVRQVRVEYRDSVEGGVGALHRAEFALAGFWTDPGFVEIADRYRIETIHSQEASLEDVFLQKTGRSLT